MKRRDFIKNTAAFCGAVSLLSLEGCVPSQSIASEFENGKIKVKKTDFGENKWVVLRSNHTNAPVFLTKNEKDGYTALLMLCTHKQCEVKPAGTVLSCPCHGAEFSFSGKVLKEPAEKDLEGYPTSWDSEFVYVHISKPAQHIAPKNLSNE